MKPTPADILIVEDHDDLRDMVKIQLTLMGYSVVCISSCAEARKQVEEGQFSLFLLDHQLNDGDGRSLRQELRELSPATPAHFHTGSVYPPTEIDEIHSQGDGFLLKPVNKEDLQNAIELLLVKPH